MAARAVLTSLVLLLLTSIGAQAQTQEPYPVPVFVTVLETPAPPRLRPEQHEAAITGAHKRMFEVAAALRKQHGDQSKNWPPAALKEYYLAEDAHRLAVARRDYEAPATSLQLADSVEDFWRGFNQSSMTMASSAEEASLIVQITGRRRISPPGPTDNRYFVRFRLAPGGKMSGERFDELTTGHKWDGLLVKHIARYTAETAYVDLEAGSMASWKQGVGGVRITLLQFIQQRIDPAAKK